jgi:hypothetical protein
LGCSGSCSCAHVCFVGAPSALCYQAGSRRGFRMSRRGAFLSPLNALLYISTFNALFRVRNVKNPARPDALSNTAWNRPFRFRLAK